MYIYIYTHIVRVCVCVFLFQKKAQLSHTKAIMTMYDSPRFHHMLLLGQGIALLDFQLRAVPQEAPSTKWKGGGDLTQIYIS